MNTKKLFFGLFAFMILLGSACTSDGNAELYDSIDRKDVMDPDDRKSIDRKDVMDPDERKAIDRKDVMDPDDRRANG